MKARELFKRPWAAIKVNNMAVLLQRGISVKIAMIYAASYPKKPIERMLASFKRNSQISP